MLAAAIIVFREILEAALIVGIVMAAAGRTAARGHDDADDQQCSAGTTSG